jgi:hypothetical protein
MLLPLKIARGVADGSVTLAFRRWRRPDVRPGQVFTTAAGLVREHPQRRATDLAALAGRETAPFKIDVRKLKNLGLTVSFRVGCELSPRGLAYLSRTTRDRSSPRL